MKRAAVITVVALVLLTGNRPDAQRAFVPLDLVGTWTLARVQQRADTATPVTVPNPRGLLVLDAGGHAIEVLSKAAIPGVADPRGRFHSFGGFWGRYRVDAVAGKVTFQPAGAVSPHLMGSEISRTIAVSGDVLTITSTPGEPHLDGVTQWTWERVPIVENLSPGYRRVIGFWQHVVEKRLNAETGAVIGESTRAPSVIAYTPSGYVAVHFPPLNRPRFAGDEPTDAEAQAALRGYIGYFGALAVYPNQVFHHIMAGLSPATGTTLKRTYEMNGDELTIRFAPTYAPDGQERTLVTLRRLSGEAEMLRR